MKELARKLLSAFAQSGYSYSELSSMTGLPKSSLQRYLTGAVGKIPIDSLVVICEALGLDTAVVLGWRDPDEEQKKRTDADRLEALHQNPRLGLLFDRQRNMKPEDIEFMLQMADRIVKERDSD